MVASGARNASPVYEQRSPFRVERNDEYLRIHRGFDVVPTDIVVRSPELQPRVKGNEVFETPLIIREIATIESNTPILRDMLR